MSMELTKRLWEQPTDKGVLAYHIIQSFSPGEATPDQVHEIGCEFARRFLADRFECTVSTHLDKGHLHNHFCFNSVSFQDGQKYNYSKAERQRLRDISDSLCREYGLSVIEHGRKAPSRPVWLDEQSGKPTRYNLSPGRRSQGQRGRERPAESPTGSRAMSWTPTLPANTPPCGGPGAKRRCGSIGWGR